jgi:hypothetical protein
MPTHDRRVFQRLRLARPILGTIDRQNALILDIGMAGAFVEHDDALTPEAPVRLQFRWRGEEIQFICDVARTEAAKGSDGSRLFHTGLRFVEAIGDSESGLRDLIATFVGSILASQKANAMGLRDSAVLALNDIGGARRARVRGLISYRLQPDGRWVRGAAVDSRQPGDGFTVAAYEEESDLEVLCRAYELADDENRQLIRLVAELSVRTVSSQ